MNLQDALFNWLQISLVAEARPEDGAARDTRDFFEQILREDHAVTRFSYVENAVEDAYQVEYDQDGQTRTQRYDRELAEQLLTDINSNPKYNE